MDFINLSEQVAFESAKSDSEQNNAPGNAVTSSIESDSSLPGLQEILVQLVKAVLINKPLCLYQCLASTLEADLDRRTLWEMQLSQYLVPYSGMKLRSPHFPGIVSEVGDAFYTSFKNSIPKNLVKHMNSSEMELSLVVNPSTIMNSSVSIEEVKDPMEMPEITDKVPLSSKNDDKDVSHGIEVMGSLHAVREYQLSSTTDVKKSVSNLSYTSFLSDDPGNNKDAFAISDGCHKLQSASDFWCAEEKNPNSANDLCDELCIIKSGAFYLSTAQSEDPPDMQSFRHQSERLTDDLSSELTYSKIARQSVDNNMLTSRIIVEGQDFPGMDFSSNDNLFLPVTLKNLESYLSPHSEAADADHYETPLNGSPSTVEEEEHQDEEEFLTPPSSLQPDCSSGTTDSSDSSRLTVDVTDTDQHQVKKMTDASVVYGEGNQKAEAESAVSLETEYAPDEFCSFSDRPSLQELFAVQVYEEDEQSKVLDYNEKMEDTSSFNRSTMEQLQLQQSLSPNVCEKLDSDEQEIMLKCSNELLLSGKNSQQNSCGKGQSGNEMVDFRETDMLNNTQITRIHERANLNARNFHCKMLVDGDNSSSNATECKEYLCGRIGSELDYGSVEIEKSSEASGSAVKDENHGIHRSIQSRLSSEKSDISLPRLYNIAIEYKDISKEEQGSPPLTVKGKVMDESLLTIGDRKHEIRAMIDTKINSENAALAEGGIVGKNQSMTEDEVRSGNLVKSEVTSKTQAIFESEFSIQERLKCIDRPLGLPECSFDEVSPSVTQSLKEQRVCGKILEDGDEKDRSLTDGYAIGAANFQFRSKSANKDDLSTEWKDNNMINLAATHTKEFMEKDPLPATEFEITAKDQTFELNTSDFLKQVLLQITEFDLTTKEKKFKSSSTGMADDVFQYGETVASEEQKRQGNSKKENYGFETRQNSLTGKEIIVAQKEPLLFANASGRTHPNMDIYENTNDIKGYDQNANDDQMAGQQLVSDEVTELEKEKDSFETTEQQNQFMKLSVTPDFVSSSDGKSISAKRNNWLQIKTSGTDILRHGIHVLGSPDSTVETIEVNNTYDDSGDNNGNDQGRTYSQLSSKEIDLALTRCSEVWQLNDEDLEDDWPPPPPDFINLQDNFKNQADGLTEGNEANPVVHNTGFAHLREEELIKEIHLDLSDQWPPLPGFILEEIESEKRKSENQQSEAPSDPLDLTVSISPAITNTSELALEEETEVGTSGSLLLDADGIEIVSEKEEMAVNANDCFHTADSSKEDVKDLSQSLSRRLMDLKFDLKESLEPLNSTGGPRYTDEELKIASRLVSQIVLSAKQSVEDYADGSVNQDQASQNPTADSSVLPGIEEKAQLPMETEVHDASYLRDDGRSLLKCQYMMSEKAVITEKSSKTEQDGNTMVLADTSNINETSNENLILDDIQYIGLSLATDNADKDKTYLTDQLQQDVKIDDTMIAKPQLEFQPDLSSSDSRYELNKCADDDTVAHDKDSLATDEDSDMECKTRHFCAVASSAFTDLTKVTGSQGDMKSHYSIQSDIELGVPTHMSLSDTDMHLIGSSRSLQLPNLGKLFSWVAEKDDIEAASSDRMETASVNALDLDNVVTCSQSTTLEEDDSSIELIQATEELLLGCSHVEGPSVQCTCSSVEHEKFSKINAQCKVLAWTQVQGEETVEDADEWSSVAIDSEADQSEKVYEINNEHDEVKKKFSEVLKSMKLNIFSSSEIESSYEDIVHSIFSLPLKSELLKASGVKKEFDEIMIIDSPDNCDTDTASGLASPFMSIVIRTPEESEINTAHSEVVELHLLPQVYDTANITLVSDNDVVEPVSDFREIEIDDVCLSLMSASSDLPYEDRGDYEELNNILPDGLPNTSDALEDSLAHSVSLTNQLCDLEPSPSQMAKDVVEARDAKVSAPMLESQSDSEGTHLVDSSNYSEVGSYSTNYSEMLLPEGSEVRRLCKLKNKTHLSEEMNTQKVTCLLCNIDRAASTGNPDSVAVPLSENSDWIYTGKTWIFEDYSAIESMNADNKAEIHQLEEDAGKMPSSANFQILASLAVDDKAPAGKGIIRAGEGKQAMDLADDNLRQLKAFSKMSDIVEKQILGFCQTEDEETLASKANKKATDDKLTFDSTVSGRISRLDTYPAADVSDVSQSYQTAEDTLSIVESFSSVDGLHEAESLPQLKALSSFGSLSDMKAKTGSDQGMFLQDGKQPNEPEQCTEIGTTAKDSAVENASAANDANLVSRQITSVAGIPEIFAKTKVPIQEKGANTDSELVNLSDKFMSLNLLSSFSQDEIETTGNSKESLMQELVYSFGTSLDEEQLFAIDCQMVFEESRRNLEKEPIIEFNQELEDAQSSNQDQGKTGLQDQGGNLKLNLASHFSHSVVEVTMKEDCQIGEMNTPMHSATYEFNPVSDLKLGSVTSGRGGLEKFSDDPSSLSFSDLAVLGKNPPTDGQFVKPLVSLNSEPDLQTFKLYFEDLKQLDALQTSARQNTGIDFQHDLVSDLGERKSDVDLSEYVTEMTSNEQSVDNTRWLEAKVPDISVISLSVSNQVPEELLKEASRLPTIVEQEFPEEEQEEDDVTVTTSDDKKVQRENK